MTIPRNDTHSEAAQWFSLVRSGEISIEQDRDWRAWIGANARNLEAYENIELAWELCGELRGRDSVEELLRQVDAGFPSVSSRRRRVSTGLIRPWHRYLAAAAVVLLGVAIVLVINNRSSFSDYEAGIGEQKVITLADNSVITLNTRSHVQVKLTRATRHVDLLSGEALFNVAKDSARPFEVQALGGVSTAVGTEFDVRIGNDGAQVTVLEGHVNIRTEAHPDAPRTQLSAGQVVGYSADQLISTVHVADTNAIRGWLSHRIVLSDMPLSNALIEYNRYFRVPIVIGDTALASRHINGVFRIDDQASFINALEQGLQVTAVLADGSIVLKSKSR